MRQEQPKTNIVDLTTKLRTIVSTAKDEEQAYLDSNLGVIKNEIDSIKQKIPYPEVGRYDVGHDPEEIKWIQYCKERNQRFWVPLDSWSSYYDADPLYIGHLQMQGKPDFFFIDNILESKKLSNNTWLIATMDSRYNDFRRTWRFPKGKRDVLFSRNVKIKNKRVESVAPIFDASNELVSNISDSYLRNALIRNKGKTGIVRIIQTIQEKQDDIMTDGLKDSFIVQGCAGSGKTVVLLNRLRYLIFNKKISSQYSILVPSEQFRWFILNAALEYGIDANSIYTYRQYYSSLLSSQTKVVADETLFSPNFLARVYSEELIGECYNDLIHSIYDKVENLIDYCEGKINALAANSVKALTEEQISINENYVNEILKCIAPIKVLLVGIDDEKIEPKKILSLAKLFLGNAVQKFNAERARISALQFMVTEEEVLKYDKNILELKEEVLDAKEKASKANIFTRAFRYKKLTMVRAEYESKYKEIEEQLIAQKRQDMLNNDLDILENGLTIDEFKKVVKETEELVAKYEELLETKAEQIANPQIYIASKYKLEGAVLSEFLDYFESIKARINETAQQLLTSKDLFCELFDHAKLVYDTFIALDVGRNKKDENKKKAELKLFAHQDVTELYGFFQMALMTKCKTIIAQEFDVELSEGCKYYNFLSLYFSYLVKGAVAKPSKYIFIDEAQDLSRAELNLIYRLNNMPIMNLFGDINQVITLYGVKDWTQIDFISKKYNLDENFRNTNQVVDYCNSCLPITMKMKKIGVDMDAVDIFDTAEVFIQKIKDLSEYSIIVRDENAKSDLTLFFNSEGIAKNDSNIYTVKECKGLEFHKIIVFSCDMTDNEKYIACTRSLNKLVIVERLPHLGNHF